MGRSTTKETVNDKAYKVSNPLRAKLIIIESLVFLIPGLAIAYVYYQKQIVFDITQILIFLAVLVLILGGMIILRQFFDRILMVQAIMKKVEAGDRYILDVEKGAGELQEITESFNNLMQKFQVANNELQSRLEEIAERKLIESALKSAKEAAEVANKTKSRFLTNMSHEFLTPLNAVIGFSQILREKTHGELNEKQIKHVDNVLESGQHLLKLVNRVLKLSEIETECVELEFSKFNPGEELRDTVSMARGAADQKMIEVALDIEPDLPDLTADRDKFRPIIGNLLNNAVKFTPDGGEIRISLNRYSSPQFQDSGSEDQVIQSQLSHADVDCIQISINDTGVGIRPEDQERIFSIFEQADMSMKRLFAGIGIGLAVSRKLAELHNGKIWAKSEGEGKGSTFFFALPV